MGRRTWVALLLALFAAAALAAGPGAVRKQVEASMLVTGSVLIEPDGSVSGWELDQRDKLPAAVVELIEGSVQAWKFEPVTVDGRPRKARARMSLRLVANRVDADNYRVAIRDGYFGGDATGAEEQRRIAESESIRPIDMRPPQYPMQAAQMGAQGTVYLVVRINRQGAVEDVVAEQVNLKTIASEAQMERMRTMFAKSALAAARKWTFRPPVAGESADDAYWSMRVPVDYGFGDTRKPGYGEWEAYIPGPRQTVPWVGGQVDADPGPDAMVAGGIYQIGKGLKLLTPLQGG